MNTRTTFAACLVIASLLAGGSHLQAEDPGYGNTGGNPLTSLMQGLNPANWKMPKLKMPTMDKFLPTKSEKDRVITKKDGLVQEVSKTAKKSWQRTKDTLNPMKLIPVGFRQNQQTTPAPKKEGGFFSGLFGPKEEAAPTSSVTDFLKQDPIR